MIKFSSTEEKSKVKTYEPTFNKTIKRLIKEYLTIKSSDENVIDRKLRIEGEELLIDSITELIKSEKDSSVKLIKENNIQQSIHFVDFRRLDNIITNLREQLSEIENTPSPEDIFSAEDYELDTEGNIVLNSLNNIPNDYFSEIIRSEQAGVYFESGNKIVIGQSNDGRSWNLKFDYNKTNYLDKDEFLREEKEFIQDFLESAQKLVGTNKINLFS
jgi:hypothetical protein